MQLCEELNFNKELTEHLKNVELVDWKIIFNRLF